MLKLKSPLARKGYLIYESLRHVLEPEHTGKYVAIEVDSGDYFLGNDLNEALENAENEYPDREFFVVKVGKLATASFKHRHSI